MLMLTRRPPEPRRWVEQRLLFEQGAGHRQQAVDDGCAKRGRGCGRTGATPHNGDG